jgi:phosphomevalonate kinase
MSRRFVAPGKVVVLGEYAVLDGAPALVAAVDIGVACTFTPGDTQTTTSPYGDTRFVDAALAREQAPVGCYAFSDHNAPQTESKPGLGGSAAATVVATYAARALSGRTVSPEAVFRSAYATHHEVQGSGSGVDVAASTFGGMLRFYRGQVPEPVPASDLVVVWSGSSAKTGPRVQRYRAWAAGPEGRAFVARTTELVDAFQTSPLQAMRASQRLLVDMARAADIAYLTPALTHIVSLAEDHGGAGKPSGAGGGDCAIAVFRDAAARAAFSRACEDAGYLVLSTTRAAGVRELT